MDVFTYNDHGFSITVGDQSQSVLWSSITKINVYKKDLLTTDLICMNIFVDDYFFTIHEELPGWLQFVIKTKDIFPGIPKGWDIDVIQPPFATNFKTIYTK